LGFVTITLDAHHIEVKSARITYWRLTYHEACL